MDHTIRYGRDSQLSVDIDPSQLVAHGGKQVDSLDSIETRLKEVLESPTDYPPLFEWIVPGDRVAIVIDPSVSNAAELVSGVMNYLETIDREPAHISIVLPSDGEKLQEEIQSKLVVKPDPGAVPEVEFVLHDAKDQDRLSFLMANQKGEAVYLNRNLTEADFVIPILAARLDRSLDYRGVYSGIYPTYGDKASRNRFAMATGEAHQHRAEHRGETNEVGFTLGLHFLIQVVPGPGGGIMDILAGESKSVQHAACRLSEQQWSLSTDARADVVIATLGGLEQDWDALARLLYQVDQYGEDEAVIVICSEIAVEPGRGIHCLRDLGVDPDATLREIRSQESGDMLAAILLAQLMETHQVFLLSKLEPDLVDDLGLGVLSNPADLSRLCRNRTVAIIEDAQLVQPVSFGSLAEAEGND